MLPTNFLSRLRVHLWQERAALSRSETRLIQTGRYVFSLTRDLFEGQLSMRAMSLVYTTLLSLVPFLALGFSVLKALGVRNTLEPVLFELLRPLGPQAADLTGKIIGFVEKIQVGLLGSVGVALLFYTAISLIQKVESSFNYIWRIERSRPFVQRVGEYLSVLMVGPVMVFAALGITASVLNSGVVTQIKNIEPFGFALYSLTRLIPYAMIVGMFTFLYAYMPNTKVNLKAAAIAGLTSGVLWQTASVAFASFVAGTTNYDAIYSSFAVVILLLIWLYVGWLILLIGCQLAFYIQHPAHMKPDRIVPLASGRHSEYLALMIMGTAGQRFIEGKPAVAQEDLVRELGAAPEHVARAVDTLIARGFLTESGRLRTQLIPARDLESATLGDLWRAIRAGTSELKPQQELGREIVELLDDAERGFVESKGRTSLREWLKKDAG
ncbi:tRNA-processing RNAse BN [Panacagrimonas perspica]|uniref:tRNA-processing RNAse BN n=1 Tax=Panacagrimonas perspica TaxID=381431 RepID=A0A4S3K8R3_9GAMM|nr:YihY/virulence factor BrkB family protein [Panacagrimonas perspica]TDU24227.1 tRNA-processing RNAse BN [Panacagrimonas perspica]THD04636.1 ribonuclease BN [Panacagrimonas perspica]